MSKNIKKPSKQSALIQPILDTPQIIPTKQQRITNLINISNDSMYKSIQSGDITIQDVQEIAKQLITIQSQSIFNQIMKGHFEVNHEPIPYNISKKKMEKELNLQENFQGLLTSKEDLNSPEQSQIRRINATLKQLQESIRRQKQIEKNQSKKLQQKAKQFIQKVQKEKEDFEQKLKNKKSSSRLFARAYSEDTIRVMKDKLAQRVQQKKEQLAQKLKNIEKRKAERLQKSVNSQVSYWEKVRQYESQKIKQYESCKNLKREQTVDSLLPQIKYPLISSITSKDQVDKNRFLKRFLKQQKLKSSSVLENKFQKIDQYVSKAKLKLHQFQNPSKHQQSSSKLQILQNSNNNLFDDLYISNKGHSTNHNHSEHQINMIDQFRQDLEKSKLKMIQDNKKLKNSLKASLKKHVELSPLIGSQKGINPENESLSVNASNLKPTKNRNHVSLEDSWNSILNKIKFHNLNKVQGLAQLSDIEKRLDQYDNQGIANRLKIKATLVAEIQKEKAEMTVSKVFEDVKNQKEAKHQISFKNSQIKSKENLLIKNSQNRGLQSNDNQFISQQFKNKALGKL